jgi:hypothetical protein
MAPSSYDPTVADILRVRRYFTLIPQPLPKELVDDILDLASYWAHTSLTFEEIQSVTARDASIVESMYMRALPLAFPNTAGDFTLSARENNSKDPKRKTYTLLREQDPTSDEFIAMAPSGQPSNPIAAHPCRKIVFQLWSHDQGWTTSHPHDQGTYRNSFTWIGARIEKAQFGMSADLFAGGSGSSLLKTPVNFIPRALPGSDETFTHVQTNVQVNSETTHHTVTWHHLDSVRKGSQDAQEADARGEDWKALDGRFVKAMRPGDCISLWMRARLRLWKCTLEKAKITVYWAV